MGLEERKNSTYIKKAKIFPEIPADCHSHAIGQNCATWPPRCRKAGKHGFVDEHIGSPNKLALEEGGVKCYSEGLRGGGQSPTNSPKIFKAGIMFSVPSRHSLRNSF